MKNLNIFKRSFTLAMILLMLLNSMVLADNLQNDVVVGGNDTFILGGSTSVNYRITANNGDGENGCNATETSPALVTIIVPSGVTANPGSLTFTSCATEKGVVFSSTAVGNYEITVSVADSGAGTYNTNPAKFALKVLAPLPPTDSTPPVITPSVSGTLGNNGWYVSDVTVSWSLEDNESAITSTSGCDPTTIATDTEGIELTCSATSSGGTDSKSVTIKRDATKPTISADLKPSNIGWYNIATGAPIIVFDCSDAMSDIASCPTDHFFGEGEDQSYSGIAYDNAGNSASAGFSGVKVDLTAPEITAALDIFPDANNGWFNETTGAPTVEFTCDDATSGLFSCPDDYTFGEGANQSHTGTAVDNAGNSASDSVSGVNVDLTAPKITWIGGPAHEASYYFGFVPSEPTCTASDDTSGLDGVCSVSGYGNSTGPYTLTATAYDLAGNETVETRSYTVLAWTLNGFYKPVVMGDVWNTVKGGSTVPLKFNVFAGTTELTVTSSIEPFKVVQVACEKEPLEDPVEFTTTGGTSLRYDAVAGQFIQNWQTPKLPGKCYVVTLTTDDGSSLSAFFKLK
jgi:hypothetical protein